MKIFTHQFLMEIPTGIVDEWLKDTAKCYTDTGFLPEDVVLLCHIMISSPDKVTFDAHTKTYKYEACPKFSKHNSMHPLDQAAVVLCKLHTNMTNALLFNHLHLERFFKFDVNAQYITASKTSKVSKIIKFVFRTAPACVKNAFVLPFRRCPSKLPFFLPDFNVPNLG